MKTSVPRTPLVSGKVLAHAAGRLLDHEQRAEGTVVERVEHHDRVCISDPIADDGWYPAVDVVHDEGRWTHFADHCDEQLLRDRGVCRGAGEEPHGM